MLLKTLLAGLAAACLAIPAATASSSSSELRAPKRDAADTRLGAATLAAVVTATGDVTRGNGAFLAARTSPGTYDVSFERDVRECTHAVTVSGSSAGVAVVAANANTPHNLSVRVFDTNGNPIDRAFHVVVHCAL